MSKFNQPLTKPKKPASKDWAAWHIIAAVRDTGTNLQQLSYAYGYKAGVLRNALHGPAPKYERLIAEHLGTTPQQIWPSRYHADGRSKSGRSERGMGRYKRKTTGPTNAGRKSNKSNDTSVKAGRNVNVNG